MFGVNTRDFKNAIIYHDHSERSKGNAWRYLDFIHVVDAKTARLFDPVFDEWIPQGVFSFSFREVCTFDDETVFAHFLSTKVCREVAGLIMKSMVCPLRCLPITLGVLRALPTLPPPRIIGQGQFNKGILVESRFTVPGTGSDRFGRKTRTPPEDYPPAAFVFS